MNVYAAIWVRDSVKERDPLLKCILWALSTYNDWCTMNRLIRDSGVSRSTIKKKLKIARDRGWVVSRQWENRLGRIESKFKINAGVAQ